MRCRVQRRRYRQSICRPRREGHHGSNRSAGGSSDHGFFLGEHRFYDKRLMYEPSIRIPMMMRYPALIKAGTTSDKMVLNLDIPSTLLDLAGVRIQRRFRERAYCRLRRERMFPGAKTGSMSTTSIPDTRMFLPVAAFAPSATCTFITSRRTHTSFMTCRQIRTRCTICMATLAMRTL